jgi:CDP-glycerol glycerophosphotransferase
MSKLKSPLIYILARYRKARKDWLGSAKQYRKLARLYPKNTNLKRQLVVSLYKSRQFKECLEVITRDDLLQHDGRISQLKLRCLDKIGAYEELQTAAGAMRKDADASLAMTAQSFFALSLMKLNEITYAENEYKKLLDSATVLSSQSHIVEANYQLGQIKEKAALTKEANLYYDAAIEASSSPRIKKFGIAILHKKHGRQRDALESFLELTKKQPDDYRLWFEIGHQYIKLFDKNKAAEAFNTAINLEQANRHQEIDTKRIVFDAYNGRAYACSPRAIYEALIKDRRFKDYTFVWVLRSDSMTRYWRLYFNRRTKIVKSRTNEYFREYGRAKYWIVNSRMLLLRKTDPSQVYVQTWHGTPLKKLGHSFEKKAADDEFTLHVDADEDTKRFDYFVSQSSQATKYFTDAFHLDMLSKKDAVIETGYPRNDFLQTHRPSDVKRAKARFRLPKDKKVLLYAPTWRDDQYDKHRGVTFNLESNFDYLKTQLGDEWIILFRAHYMVAKGFNFTKYDGFVRDVSDVDEINSLYIVSDALMTDYSSVFFDYANLGRPIIFYMYDLEHYRDKLRGFYLNTDELPGDIVKQEEGVVKIIQNLDAYMKKHSRRYKDFQKKFVPMDDGHATDRVIERIFFSDNNKNLSARAE